jgi:hypothetical protein
MACKGRGEGVGLCMYSAEATMMLCTDLWQRLMSLQAGGTPSVGSQPETGSPAVMISFKRWG